MEYRPPTVEDKEALLGYLSECEDNGEHDVLLAQGLFVEDCPAWVDYIRDNAETGRAQWGRSILLLCCEGSEVIGILCIRHELTKELRDIYGTIGYSVRPSRRNRGHATRMLRHALDVCTYLGLTTVTLGCFKDNVASAAVIRKCGGTLIAEGDTYEQGHMSQYFEIRLS